jgi:hypothetical protein
MSPVVLKFTSIPRTKTSSCVITHFGAFVSCYRKPQKINAFVFKLSSLLFESSLILLPTANLDKLLLQMMCFCQEM